MTQKDYWTIASALAYTASYNDNPGDTILLRKAAENIADVMAKDNPRFKREKFLDACKWTEARKAEIIRQLS